MAVVTFREAVAQVLREEMRRNPRIFLLGEDIVDYGGTYGVTRGFAEEFGEKRVKDTPIAESVIIGAAVTARAVASRMAKMSMPSTRSPGML